MKSLVLIRRALGATHYKMAKLLGVTQSAYTYYETHTTSVRLDVLCRIREIAQLSWEEFGKMLEMEALTIEPERRGRKPDTDATPIAGRWRKKV